MAEELKVNTAGLESSGAAPAQIERMRFELSLVSLVSSFAFDSRVSLHEGSARLHFQVKRLSFTLCHLLTFELCPNQNRS